MAVTQTNKALSIWKGTAEQFQGITTKGADTLYFVSGNTGDLTGTVYVGANKYGTTFRSVAAFPEAAQAEVGVVYLGPAGEAKFYSGTAWIQVCYPLVTSITSGSTDYAVPSAKAVFTYVNTFAAGLGRLLPAVAAVADLSDISDAMDKDLILVEDSGALYRFDAESTATADGDKIVGTGDGRWIKMITATNMTEGNGIKIENNVVSVDYDTTVFTVDETGKITMNPTYIGAINTAVSTAQTTATNAANAAAAAQQTADGALALAGTANTNATQALADAAAAQQAADDAQADATQALADAATAKTTADAAIPKLSNAVGTRVALTAANGTITESTMTVGGNALGTTAALRENKLATETAVQAAIDAAVLGDIQGNIDSAVETATSGKMDKVASPTAGNLVGMDANGNSTNSGKTVGGATLAAYPNETTLATEAAVKTAVAIAKSEAINSAKIFWYEGTGDVEPQVPEHI